MLKQKMPLLFFFLVLTTPIFTQNVRATGLQFNDNNYQNAPRLSPSLKFTTNDIPVVSLKKFCPIPGNQGEMGSCVGWATSYAALSISQAIKENQTNRQLITEQAKSALYVYNQIKVIDCIPGGAHIEDALDLMKEKGSCMQNEFSPNTCDVLPTNLEDIKARDNRIKEYFTLFHVDAIPEKKINATINSLKANKPVVIGMNVTQSFFNIDATGLWKPDQLEKKMGGHAMCVVGYNQITRTFELMNSYGSDWGKGGFLTISFEDFGNYCKYGYQFSLLEKTKNISNFAFQGTFEIKKLRYEDDNPIFDKIAAQRTDEEYQIKTGILSKGDFLKIFAKNLKEDNYLYIFSIKPDKTTELLFPNSSLIDGATVKDLPLIPSNNAYIEIPNDENKAIQADMSGQDYIVCLYASKKIDNIYSIVKSMANKKEDISVIKKLQDIFSNDLVPTAYINYPNNYIGFTGNSTFGYIVPLVVNVSVAE